MKNAKNYHYFSIYLQTPEPENWPGALIVLYQLVKNYEYKKKEDRTPLHEAMNLLLPQIYEIGFRSMNDKSQEMTTVRKIILKIYFALTQYVLPLELINREVFTNWMEFLRLVLEQDIPQEAQVNTDIMNNRVKPTWGKFYIRKYYFEYIYMPFY